MQINYKTYLILKINQDLSKVLEKIITPAKLIKLTKMAFVLKKKYKLKHLINIFLI